MHISLNLIVPVKVRSLSAQLDVKHIYLRFNDCAAGAGWIAGWLKGRRKVVNIMGYLINILYNLSFEICPRAACGLWGAVAQETGLLLKPDHMEDSTACYQCETRQPGSSSHQGLHGRRSE